MKKIKLLIANDAHYLGTGYAVYGKELLTRLQNNEKYEVAELACYATINTPQIKNCPWKVYPNAIEANSNDKRLQIFKQNNINQFGSWRFDKAVLHFKPDIVFDIRDYWMYSYQEISSFRKYFSWVIMPTVDSAPQKEEWLFTFANADMVVPYTQWAKKVLLDQCGNKIKLFNKIANAGVNINEFKPVKNKKQHQTDFFGKEVSIIGSVMRNQKRKLFPDLFSAYRSYLDKLLSESKKDLYNKSYLYLHTSYPEQNGWDFGSLLKEYKLLDKVFFTHICKNCRKICPAKFHQTISKCPKCNTLSLMMPSANIPVHTKDLIDVYNTFDLFVQYAICEGFGMPQVEAASCGVPICSVDYSAMTEIAENLEGYKIPVKRMFRELETNADRAYPDIEKTIEIFYDFFVHKNEEQRNNMSINTRNLCKKHYTWDNVYKVWDECFQSIDLSKNTNWNNINPNPTNHQNMSVPGNLSPKDFIEYICKNVINEPYLIKTAYIQNLIKQFTSGIFADSNSIKSYSYQDIVKILETFLNRKLSTIEAMKNPTEIFKEDFLNVNN